ncbi:MAG: hypothetical protein NZM25_01790 [Leptospiraceae bacterium]|nr:hypothetical protein [Leptospiraceae bacterium]MDW8306907.1 hypothetical protein [Leptospiraceae bacterium]
MKKFFLLGIFLGLVGVLVALTESEKQCIEEKRKSLQQEIERCRKQHSDPKDISVCAQAAKQEFALLVKTCYEKKE